MAIDRALPAYERLFDVDLDFRREDEARTVYAPGAYLADLLALMEQVFDRPSLLEEGRRPDLRKILLDAENTFAESPYLDIVVQVLEQLIGDGDPYEVLRTAAHPFALPFSLHDAEFSTYLAHLEVGPEELYRLFAPYADADTVARLYLGLSHEDVANATTEGDAARVRALYGLSPADELPADVETFRRAAGLSALALRELLVQDEDPARPPATFFVNAGGAPVTLSEDGTKLVRGSEPPPVTWYDRVSRLVRLARRTGLTTTELDRVLVTCCAGTLDAAALRTVAVVVHLRRGHDLSVDEVCGLAVPIRTPGYDDLPALSGDLLATHNKEYRRALARFAGVAESDLAEIVRRYRDRYDALVPSPFDRGEIGLPAVALLQRAGRLAAMLGVSAGELFDLLEILESDPSAQRYSTFTVLGGIEPRSRDCYRILAGEDVASSLWLAQLLPAVARWAQTAGFATTELKEILGGRSADRDDEDQVMVLESLHQNLAAVAMGPEMFAGERFGERAAQVVHDVLRSYAGGVVSARDDRLLRFDPEGAAVAAHDAVTQLGVIVDDDFTGLGLGERLAGKIFSGLVLGGWLDPEGRLARTDLPETDHGLKLERDFSALRQPLFKLINSVGNGTAAFFPSDLATLGDLTPEEQAELYDNLVHHGYVEEDGTVPAPEFFADEAAEEWFEVNAGLADVAPAVLDELRDRIDWFRRQPLALDQEIFAGLRLGEYALERLAQGLRFNGYLDADGGYADKVALAALGPEDLALPPEFHPHRQAVLDAMKGQIAVLEAEAYTFTPEDFADVADSAVAQRVMAALEGAVLDEGRVVGDLAELDLGGGFRPEESAVVAARIEECLDDERPYRLDPEAVAALGFTEEGRDALLQVLVQAGHLDAALAVPRAAVPYFAQAGNALLFTLPGLADYAREVFHLLHAVATEIAAATGEIVAAVEARAVRQREALAGTLADAFGVPAETAAAICAGVCGGPAEAVELLGAPALAAGDGDGEVLAVPADPHLRAAYRRIRRFALLAAKLGLDPTEVSVAFQDQNLTGKYPEPLALPPDVESVDAVLSSADGNVYVFAPGGYWAYSAATYALLDPRARQLPELSPRFAGMSGVDAAFARPDGSEWIVCRGADGNSHVFVKEPGSIRWEPRAQVWGRVRNNFDAPKRIDSAFADEDGRTFLFCGDQYVRYSGPGYDVVDEGYPRGIAEWWRAEGHDAPLPPAFGRSLDACFQDVDGRTHLFTAGRYLTVGQEERPISARWGRVRNLFDGMDGLDSAFTADDGRIYLLRGDQVAGYSGSLENDGVRMDDGYPRKIAARFPGLPGEFESGVDAAFAEPSGLVHLFKDGRTVAGGASGVGVPGLTAERWGRTRDALEEGRVDAGFVGLDGRTYVFSGERYLRYSGADYSVVDLGYPRRIAGDWGGLRRVDASFVMDGQTYLFGAGGRLFELPLEQAAELDAGRLSPALRRRFMEHGLTFADGTAVVGVSGEEGAPAWRVSTEQGVAVTLRGNPLHIQAHADGGDFYVRYSTRDYTVPDPGYPKPVSDNWWNLPATLVADPRLARIDAVFTGPGGQTYLFSGPHFVVFDSRHRWWSEPRTLAGHWDSLPFPTVDAAFTGKDGRTYVFSGDSYVRYSSADFTRIDDRFPASVPAYWGNVVSRIARTGRVDAALVMDATELVDGRQVTTRYTYLFAGDQYVRYADDDLTTVQDGYPQALSALGKEPRLAGLDVGLDRIDAAFADRRNVYLVSGGRLHVVSDTLYRRYDDLRLSGTTCAFMEDGSVLTEDAAGWHQRSAIEASTHTTTPVRPRLLREVPAEFATGLDAVLSGADGNTYLFSGARCFSTRLNRAYPLAEEWGRPRNTIYQDNAVDAAFVGRDGRTYLFRGDQFVVYTDVNGMIDGEPRPVAEHWGGLRDVALAYVRGEQTYLFEAADGYGEMRCVVYSGDDYTTPDDDYPRTVDESFWEVPPDYRVPGHHRPDAVLTEQDSTLLLYGEQVLRFDESTRQWSYPRPSRRLWPGLGQGLEPGDALRTAFVAQDGSTYFFFTEHYTRYAAHAFEPPASIRGRWGRTLNPFVTDDDAARVDAAVVWRGETTFLFAGDRYVRYTGSEYRYVDPGYPKKIIGNLRHEAAFANLPEAFDEALTDRVAAGQSRLITAALAGRRTIHLVVGDSCHVVSASASATYELGALGRVRNTIADREKVDATLVRGAHTFLFCGDQYVRYTDTEYDHVDDGYPRTIDGSLAAELGLPALPDRFADGLDAAFHVPGGGTYLFKDADYLRADADAEPRPITGQWGRVRNAFADAAGAVVDAAFAGPAGELYAFRSGQYVRYRPYETEYVEEGFPRTVDDDWGDLPDGFEQGPDGAFVFEGRTYLCKGEEYVRYSRPGTTVDRAFPQRFAHRWADTADYRLSDVHTIVRFADLARSHPDGLPAFLLNGPASVAEPYGYLAGLFGWDADEIRWARRNAALLIPATPPTPPAITPPVEEDRFEIEFLLKLADLFELTDRIGTAPSTLYTEVWRPAFAPPPALAGAAAGLLRILESTRAPEEWQALSAGLHDRLNMLRRDALVAAATSGGPSKELYERFLVDVDMGPEGRTSRVREAIAAAQLYLHRYLLDLERVSLPPGEDEEATRQEVKRWWAWMRNYRLWEANRKVFLYPENYVRPELRTAKTPAFADLEEELLQGEITQDRVERAYKRYLDEYTEVSRLAIAGGYVYRADGAEEGVRRLVMFGRTRTEPRRHYCREAEFRDGEKLSATWEPWLRVDVQIGSELVYPVHAFGRIFVFWPVVEAVEPDDVSSTTIVTRQDGATQSVSGSAPMHRVRIHYSFRNLNGEWVPAQVLPVEEVRDAPISGVRLYVQASATVPGEAGHVHDTIVITCTYTVTRPAPAEPERIVSGFVLTPELYAIRAEDVTEPPRASKLDRIFDEPVDESAAVYFAKPVGADAGVWLSVDHKGGSFLCRPSAPPGGTEERRSLDGNRAGLPTTWTAVHAAVELGDGVRYFFGNGDEEHEPFFAEVPDGGSAAGLSGSPVAGRWGHVATDLYTRQRVDAALVRGEHTFLFAGPFYYRYSGQPFGDLIDEGYPKEIARNDEDLPRWERIDAAGHTIDGKEFFYHREHGYVDSADPRGTPRALPWRVPGDAPVTGIVQLRGDMYLFYGTDNRYVRYDAAGSASNPNGHALSRNGDGLPRSGPVNAPFVSGDSAWFFDNDAGTYTSITPRTRNGERQFVQSEPVPIRPLGVAGSRVTRHGVDAAYVAGGSLFLAKDLEYVRYSLAGGAPGPLADPGYPRPMVRPVRAVLKREGVTYVFSGTDHAVLEPARELGDELSYAPVAGNWGGLPADWLENLDGVLDAGDLYLFLGPEYVAYPSAVAVQRPYAIAGLPHEVIRLTSSTAYRLNKALLTGGVAELLAPRTQEIDELPAFSASVSDATTIKVHRRVAEQGVPVSSHLDFTSGNGIYYWEVFFHATVLIARALNDAQRFDEARTWYEYVFNPTQPRYWRFLPFLAVDVDALIASTRADLAELAALGVDVSKPGGLIEDILVRLEPMAPAFHQSRELTAAEADYLAGLSTGLPTADLADVETALAALRAGPQARPALDGLRERMAMIGRLRRQYDLMGDRGTLLRTYMEDPFDPHAIAELRPSAYRRAVVMAYVDNLLDWGDLLFRQYTGESLDEARMLYVFAYDLLGERPEDLGPRPSEQPYSYERIVQERPEAGGELTALTAGGALLEGPGAVHGSVASPYFHVPGNTVFLEYWDRVEDRLRKIRASLDILGVSRPLPLFEPPVDVLALVRGVAGGAALDQLADAQAVPVPHQRFSFTFRRAQELADKLKGFAADLIGVLERKDAEELALLQNRNEAAILDLTLAIKQAHAEIAAEGLDEARASLTGAAERVSHYEQLLATGLSATQRAQLDAMTHGANLMFAGSGLSISAAIAGGLPELMIGPFVVGTKYGGIHVAGVLGHTAEFLTTLGEAMSMQGEMFGVQAEQERMVEDWRLQLGTAKSDVVQLTHQVAGAELQLKAAQRELEVLRREIANLESVDAFMRDKFGTAQLYQWMSGRLSAMYFQSYDLAYGMARAAQRAYQYERGIPEGEADFIQPVYWESRRRGLLAGESLAVDLERLGRAYAEGDSRGLEIVRKVSLLALDPLAALSLRATGRCEFALTEPLFDRDFPGHYRRRIRTLSVSFEGEEGPIGLNATLTQLDSKTVLAADPKAVKYLIDPKGPMPDTLRVNWRPGQQIALSDLEESKENNGLFELRYDDDRYLPFEGTGAVSRWRLELSAPGAPELRDVVVTVKYTAEQGGEPFANAVRGMLKPYPAARYVDVAAEFPDEWAEFVQGEGDWLTLPIEPELLPGISGRQITGLFPRYDVTGEASARFLIDGDGRLALDEGKLLPAPGLSAGGAAWSLRFEGDKAALTGFGLVLTYKARGR
ncbi:hemopexin repeat-containing protein [Nonomuraea fuscirosea]|uniref:hemopexin repeat-containing protein n=1 Tax=Nonomuraea fuscirosea TaxID=1291556 RepID=UPI00342052E3